MGNIYWLNNNHVKDFQKDNTKGAAAKQAWWNSSSNTSISSPIVYKLVSVYSKFIQCNNCKPLMRSVLYWIDNKQGFKNDQKLSKQHARSQKLSYSKLQTAMESAQQPKYPNVSDAV